MEPPFFGWRAGGAQPIHEARFEQAIRIADELGPAQQAVSIRYTFAWTMFW
jgi:hypothetical protein